MSRTIGQVAFADGTQLDFVYDGTSDVCRTRLSNDNEFNWEENQNAECTCGQDEPVMIDPNYGGMDAWKGKACRNCKAMTAGMLPYSEAFYW